MSEAARGGSAARVSGAAKSGTAAGAAPRQPAPVSISSAGWRAFIVAAFGGILTGVLFVGVLSALEGRKVVDPELQTVAKDQLADAVLSIERSATALAEEAKQCRTAMAFVTLQAASGQSSVVRIRSGSYVSPNITITDSPRRVAVPYPAPYPTGKGVLSIEGTARGLKAWLNPGRTFESLDQPAWIPVVWTPKAPCS